METTKPTAEELVKRAGAAQAPQGMKLEEWNPLENIPTASIGKEIQAGAVLRGYFEGLERAVSAKFTNSQERDPATGLPVQYLFTMKLVSGDKLGIWSTAELKTIAEKLAVGDFLEIKYTGKGKNAQGRDQHFFEYKKGVVTQ